MQRHKEAIKACGDFRGPPDPLRGNEPYRRVHEGAKEAMEAIFDSSAPTGSAAGGAGTRTTGFGSASSSQYPPASGGSGRGVGALTGSTALPGQPGYDPSSPMHAPPVSSGNMVGFGSTTVAPSSGGVGGSILSAVKSAFSSSSSTATGGPSTTASASRYLPAITHSSMRSQRASPLDRPVPHSLHFAGGGFVPGRMAPPPGTGAPDYSYASNRAGPYGGAPHSSATPSYAGPSGAAHTYGGISSASAASEGNVGGAFNARGRGAPGGGWGSAPVGARGIAGGGGPGGTAGTASNVGRVGGAATDRRYERGLVEELTAPGGVRSGA